MKPLIAVMCFMLAAAPAFAADASDKKGAVAASKSAKKEPTEKQKAQQDKMRACSKEAKDKGMKGDQRKTFMSDCMKKA